MSSNDSQDDRDDDRIYQLQEVVRIFVESDVCELSVQHRDIVLKLCRGGSSSMSLPAPPVPSSVPSPSSSTPSSLPESAPESVPDSDSADTAADVLLVRTPFAGYFHRRPAPNKPPYVEVGQHVTAGSPVAIVEIMKMFNEITADHSGVVTEIRAEDGSLVAQDDVLMVLTARDES
jgi:acetyl-CoA carboxylase biotin carboxyl carrier protein